MRYLKDTPAYQNRKSRGGTTQARSKHEQCRGMRISFIDPSKSINYQIMRLITVLLGLVASSSLAFQPAPKRNIVKQHAPCETQTSVSAAVKQRLTFNSPPPLRDGKTPPKLILIGGCPGTGKSTFGMSLALEQGILKCISTDTVRAVMRSYVPESISPPLHRSSYGKQFME